MMEQVKALNVGIVGGGPGCKAIMDMILAEKLSQLRMKLVGVACTNPEAVGYRYAQGKGIYTTRDYRDLYKLTDLNMIIELTGREDVADEISLTKPNHVRLIDHIGAHVFWDLFQIEEQRITERKRAEEKLRESTRRTEIAYDQSVVYAQQLNEEIIQRKQAQEALQKAHDELEERVKERTADLAKTTKQLKMELGVRKRAEEALRLAHKDLAVYADELQAANEELSQYAYVVSHDLKAPLRAIHNYADFLREELEETLVGDEKVYLDGLNRAVRQGEQLVEDLLELSRVGATSGPIETIDIGVFLQELISSFDLSSDVEVVMGNDWPTIDTDPTLLRQILQNLISNAIKFNRSPRRRVEIGWHSLGKERYELFVRDNGIGIEPRDHEKIFGVFYRLHTREEYGGTGLGLAIVRKASGKLHGSVRVESKTGEGSTFFVVLPKTQKEKTEGSELHS